jgi:serine/threonine protein kinase
MIEPAATVGVPARLRVLEAIGMGAFGKVFLVDDASSGQRLALKRLERLDPGSVYRFKQEFRALADVRHPNLVRLHDLYSIDDSWSFTMDHVDGVRFDTWVRGLDRDRRSSSAESTRSDEIEEEAPSSAAPASSQHAPGPGPSLPLAYSSRPIPQELLRLL